MYEEVIHLRKQWWGGGWTGGWTRTPDWVTNENVWWINPWTDLGTIPVPVNTTLNQIFYPFKPMSASLWAGYTFEKWVEQAPITLTATITQSSNPVYAIDSVQFKRDWTDIWAPVTVAPRTYTETNTIVDTTIFSALVTDVKPETSTPTRTLTALYPYFYWVSATLPTADQALINGGTKVVASSTGTLTVPFNPVAEYMWFAIPATSTSKTKWYVNALNNGNIGSPSDLFWAESIVSIDSPSAYWAWVNYKIYIANYVTTQPLSIELRNS